MWQLVFKAVLSGILITLISELAKRNSLLAAAFASIPFISVISLIWLYHDTQSITQLQKLSMDIFWLVIPSLSFFLTFPALLHRQIAFYPSLFIALAVMISAYQLMLWALPRG